ncbi:hypothetical protein ABIB83_005454 [Bradyrhizobium sp. I1.8.5]
MSRTMRHRDREHYWRKAAGTSRLARLRREAAAGLEHAFGDDRTFRRLEAGSDQRGAQHVPIGEPSGAPAGAER